MKTPSKAPDLTPYTASETKSCRIAAFRISNVPYGARVIASWPSELCTSNEGWATVVLCSRWNSGKSIIPFKYISRVAFGLTCFTCRAAAIKRSSSVAAGIETSFCPLSNCTMQYFFSSAKSVALNSVDFVTCAKVIPPNVSQVKCGGLLIRGGGSLKDEASGAVTAPQTHPTDAIDATLSMRAAPVHIARPLRLRLDVPAKSPLAVPILHSPAPQWPQ
mmetsp:Transcript_18564/g.48400  ORF Transcript_18564/g.48400 Transcript_18564/m.48400 type:complete len:219 (+) Transcript_18564:1144-1800(+)